MSERDYIQSFSEYLFWDVDKTSIDLEAMLRMWLEGCLNLDNSATGISWSGDMVFRESLRLLKIFVPLIPRRFLIVDGLKVDIVSYPYDWIDDPVHSTMNMYGTKQKAVAPIKIFV